MITIDAQYPNPVSPEANQPFYSRFVGYRWKFKRLDEAIDFMRTTINADSDCDGMQLTWTREGNKE